MRKLYENIEDIYIKGNPAQLTEAITEMDVSLQTISDATEYLSEQLVRYSGSNKGAQYQRVVATVMEVRDELYLASIELNEMQNQIVAYQNKIFRYEDMTECAVAPNPHLVQRSNIYVDESVVQFSLPEMMSVVQCLAGYHELVTAHTHKLLDNRDYISTFWCDSQYNLFSQFIGEVCVAIVDALKEFSDYLAVLDQKIKELSQ